LVCPHLGVPYARQHGPTTPVRFIRPDVNPQNSSPQRNLLFPGTEFFFMFPHPFASFHFFWRIRRSTPHPPGFHPSHNMFPFSFSFAAIFSLFPHFLLAPDPFSLLVVRPPPVSSHFCALRPYFAVIFLLFPDRLLCRFFSQEVWVYAFSCGLVYSEWRSNGTTHFFCLLTFFPRAALSA